DFLTIARLLFSALHIMPLPRRGVAQPREKFGRVRWRIATCYARVVETTLAGIRYELRLQFRCRNLYHHVVAGIDDPASRLRPSFLSLLKIATATSSSVRTDVSTRMCATLAYSGSRGCSNCMNASLGFSLCSKGRVLA